MAITVPIISEWNKKALGNAQKDLNTFSNKTKKSFDGLAKAGRKIGLGLAAVGIGAIAVGKDLVAAGEAASTSNARIDQIAESMGVFGDESKTATKRIKDLANEIARKTGIDQNQIKQAQATLLTFGEIAETAGDVGSSFDRATQASIDLAAAGFGTTESNAVQLGKALNDPIKGLAALTKSGVTFTDEQKNLIASLVESGDTLEAQNMILEAIETQVGGTAEATANSSDKMGVAFSQLKEKLGQQLLPVFEQVTNWVIGTLVPALENAYNKIVPAFQNAWQSLSDTLGPIIQQMRDVLQPIFERIVQFLKENTEVVKVFFAVLAGAAVIAMIAALAAAFAGLLNPFTLVAVAIAGLAAGFKYAWENSETFRTIVTTVLDVLSTAFTAWWETLKWVFDNVIGGWDNIKAALTLVKDAFVLQFDIISGVVTTVYDVVMALVDAVKSAIDFVGDLGDVGGGIVGGAVGGIKKGAGFLGGLIPFADGGIVTGPTPALIGEAGPEAVIPLNQLGRMAGTTINNYFPPGTTAQDVLESQRQTNARRGVVNYEVAGAGVL
jgi:predicted PurR-regulated permease PerM